MPNKTFTSFDIAAEAYELKETITDSRVNNIYQIDSKTLLFKLHKVNTPPLLLLLEAGRRLHLTAYAQERPESPPIFCMALRKYLRNAWLRTVEQHEFERIVIFTFDTNEGKLQLILELFGEGNQILTTEKGMILQALIFKRMRDRNIVRAETYSFPPTSGRNPFNTTLDELTEDLKKCGNNDVVRSIARSLGIGGLYTEEILLRAEVEKTKHCTTLTDTQIKTIFENLQTLLCTLTNARFEPRIILSEDGKYLDAVPFQLKQYETCKFQPFKSFNEALDEFYLKVTVAEKSASAQAKIEPLIREADKLKRVVNEQEETISEAEIQAEKQKQIGDMIYAYSSEIQTLLNKFNDAKITGKDFGALVSDILLSQNSVKPNVWTESFDAKNMSLNVHVGVLKFSINLRKSLFENAAEYYEHGKKIKQKAGGALIALEDSRHKLEDVERKIKAAETEQIARPAKILEEFASRKLESKEWFEKFHWFISSDGMLVVAGKDVVSNEVLVKKHTSKDDIVFHAEITGAPFVVIKTEGKPASEQTLHEAGEYAAAFSRAWREGLGSADVYWVTPDQLSKTGPSGECVAHGAFFVVGKRNWMRNVPLKMTIGVLENGEPQFISGPIDAVKVKAKVYVTLMPGDMTGKEFLKQILHTLASKLPKEQREKFQKTSIELIREFVPYTKGRIIEIS